MSFEYFISIISKISFSYSIYSFDDLHVESGCRIKSIVLAASKGSWQDTCNFLEINVSLNFFSGYERDNTRRLVFPGNLSTLYLKSRNNRITFSAASCISKVK